MNDMTPTQYAERIGAEVRAELAKQRKSQADLAEALGMTPATVGKRIAGTAPFNLLELAQTAIYLGVDPRQFTSGAEAGSAA